MYLQKTTPLVRTLLCIVRIWSLYLPLDLVKWSAIQHQQIAEFYKMPIYIYVRMHMHINYKHLHSLSPYVESSNISPRQEIYNLMRYEMSVVQYAKNRICGARY